MSAEFDWSKYEKREGDKGSSKFDWSKYESREPERKSFGKEGKLVGGTLGQAIEAGIKNPLQIGKELPVAATKALESPMHLPKLISRGLTAATGFTPKSPEELGIDNTIPIDVPRQQLPSELVAERARRGLSEEDLEGAEAISDIEAMLIPSPYAVGKAAKGIKNIPKTQVQKFKKVPETFESGLIKPRGVDSKFKRYALTTADRQANAIQKLDSEAQRIAKSTIEKEAPFVKMIAEGHDFKGSFEKEFGYLKNAAEKANPVIDTSPLSEFLHNKRLQYRGIPNPHPEAKSILADIRSFSKNPQKEMDNLLKIYRSNNRKRDSIFERSILTGKQKEYDTFLKDMNKKIVESFDQTLPEGSEWLSRFKKANEDFSKFKKAEETIKQLDSVLGENFNSNSFQKIGIDPKKQAKLKIRLGEEGANEIINLSRDYRTARDVIKNMPKQQRTAFDKLYPIAFIIPGLSKYIGAAALIHKGQRGLRILYGNYLSNPAKVKVLDESMKAIMEGDLSRYAAATELLQRES